MILTITSSQQLRWYEKTYQPARAPVGTPNNKGYLISDSLDREDSLSLCVPIHTTKRRNVSAVQFE